MIIPDIIGIGVGRRRRKRSLTMNLIWREASRSDIGLLSDWNHQLIYDSGHRNPMTVEQLATRMHTWLSDEYRAILFSLDEPVAYALLNEEKDLIHLRQFFVRRDRRRHGTDMPHLRDCAERFGRWAFA